MEGGAFVKATLNIGKKAMAWLILTVMMIGGAIGIYSQYPQMKNYAARFSGNYFETSGFLNTLSDVAQYLGFELSGDIMTSDEIPNDVVYGGDWMTYYSDDFNYYAQRLDSDKVLEKNGELLAQVLKRELDVLSEEVTSKYQYVVEFQFDHEGNVTINQIYGGERLETLNRLEYKEMFSGYQVKNATIVLGVLKELPVGSQIARELHYHLEEGYVVTIIPYLVGSAIIVMLIVFIVPFAWFERLGVVRGLMVVPLELRFLFVIATCFAVIGVPFLVIWTQSGQLLQAINQNVGVSSASTMVSVINLIAWGGFIAVIALHSLYLKEFFMIGPWQMIRRHTILGQLIWLWRRPKVVTKTVVEEKVVIQEDPRVDVMVSQLALFKETLCHMRLKLEGVEGIDEVVAQLDEIVHLSDLNQPMKTINLTKLISDTMEAFEEQYASLMVKTRFPEESVFVTSNEASMTLLMKTLLAGIVEDAVDHSRVYLEMSCEENFVVFITRSVLADEANMTTLAAIEALTKQQRGTFEPLIDGDLMKLTLRFKK